MHFLFPLDLLSIHLPDARSLHQPQPNLLVLRATQQNMKTRHGMEKAVDAMFNLRKALDLNGNHQYSQKIFRTNVVSTGN
jgi:hypothetical protein